MTMKLSFILIAGCLFCHASAYAQATPAMT